MVVPVCFCREVAVFVDVLGVCVLAGPVIVTGGGAAVVTVTGATAGVSVRSAFASPGQSEPAVAVEGDAILLR